jgi:nucleotide-binding universal stress UspA family protein
VLDYTPCVATQPAKKECGVFETIVLPLDGSRRSERALPVARELAEKFHAGIILVTVVEPTRYATQMSPMDDARTIEMVLEQAQAQDRASVRRARTYVARVRDRLNQEGIRASSQVMMGPVADIILNVAAESGADIIVMSTRGRSGLQRAVLGSVADRVVRHSECPVLLVGPTGAEEARPKRPARRRG